MPKAAKLRRLEKGLDVRPPKGWWRSMRARIGQAARYKGYSVKRRAKITAGIWHGYPVATKKRLVRKHG